MNRFYISPELFKLDEFELTGEDFKHLSKVLRLKEGDLIEIYDGQNHQALGSILSIDSKSATISLSEKIDSDKENQYANITLFQGYPKQGKLETITQKNTELGVKAIVPFFAKRSIPKPSKSETKKTDRLNRVAYEASKQAGRGELLKVSPPKTFQEIKNMLKDYDYLILPYENEKTVTLKKVLESFPKQQEVQIALIIGPEGGFDQSEIDDLSELGAIPVSLGPRILRTETAGMSAVSQINYALE